MRVDRPTPAVDDAPDRVWARIAAIGADGRDQGRVLQRTHNLGKTGAARRAFEAECLRDEVEWLRAEPRVHEVHETSGRERHRLVQGKAATANGNARFGRRAGEQRGEV